MIPNKMDTKERDYKYDNVIQLDDEVSSSRKFIANVFAWMFLALLISAGFAYEFAFNPALSALVRNPITLGPTGFGTVAMFSPLAFVLVMSFGINKISFPVLTLIFAAYAAMTGISLSILFFIYAGATLAGVFGIAALVFGIMAIAGYTTHQDLTRFGSLMMMLVIGVILASVLGMFFPSLMLNNIITYLGVAAFVGLTAYDVQKLKRIGAGVEFGTASAQKMALMGALSLYLDFLNLFLFLLRLFGGNRRN